MAVNGESRCISIQEGEVMGPRHVHEISCEGGEFKVTCIANGDGVGIGSEKHKMYCLCESTDEIESFESQRQVAFSLKNVGPSVRRKDRG